MVKRAFQFLSDLVPHLSRLLCVTPWLPLLFCLLRLSELRILATEATNEPQGGEMQLVVSLVWRPGLLTPVHGSFCDTILLGTFREMFLMVPWLLLIFCLVALPPLVHSRQPGDMAAEMMAKMIF